MAILKMNLMNLLLEAVEDMPHTLKSEIMRSQEKHSIIARIV